MNPHTLIQTNEETEDADAQDHHRRLRGGALALTWLLTTLYGIWQRPGSAFENAAAGGAADARAHGARGGHAAPTQSPEEALLEQADLSFMDGRVNVLLLGYDQSPEREDEDSDLYRDEDKQLPVRRHDAGSHQL